MRVRRFIFLVLASFFPMLLLGSGEVFAASPTDQISVTHELHVTATVPPMRHIILSPTGQITEITSNTLDDIVPTAYVVNDIPGNERPLTPALMQSYRRFVPEGTAKYGILYKQTAVLAHVTTDRSSNHVGEVAFKL
jgi:hypothetical protein